MSGTTLRHLPVSSKGSKQLSTVVLPRLAGAPKALRLLALTISIFGANVLASTISSYAAPQLLTLGLSKEALSGVLLAGPLAGLLVQPVVGLMSDQSQSRWGRRRPFIAAGAVIGAFSTLMLGWASTFLGWIGSSSEKAALVISCIALYLMQSSINALASVNRSLIIDLVPPSDEALGNAWASRMASLGSITGYSLGWVDLPSATGGLVGKSQLQVLALFDALLLISCHSITVFCTRESPAKERQTKRSIWNLVSEFRRTWSTLLSDGKSTYWVDFFSFFGWSPMLSFTSTWVVETTMSLNPNMTSDDANRRASLAFLFHSGVNLFSTLLLPMLVAPTLENQEAAKKNPSWSIHIKWLTLPLLWTISNFFHAVILVCSYWAHRTEIGVIALVASAGCPFAVTCWAPFAIIGDVLASPPATTHDPETDAEGGEIEHTGDETPHATTFKQSQTGAVLGLHNVFVVIPEFISMGISSAVFVLIDPTKSAFKKRSLHLWPRSIFDKMKEWDSIGLLFRIGALFVIVAVIYGAFWSIRYSKERHEAAEIRLLKRSEQNPAGLGAQFPEEEENSTSESEGEGDDGM
ncbi:MFS general substrate transporter [Meredithblackwellia eburnea MCA 4105]